MRGHWRKILLEAGPNMLHSRYSTHPPPSPPPQELPSIAASAGERRGLGQLLVLAILFGPSPKNLTVVFSRPFLLRAEQGRASADRNEKEGEAR